MSKAYDVIVIGAGLGGLSAATAIAQRGHSVLLLERHNVPGGYATSFVRGRYEFEVALHELSGIGPPEHRGPLHRYLDSLGVARRVTFLPVPELYRSVFPDLDLVLPVGRQAYQDKLCETFPQQAAGIRRFLGRIDGLGREMAKLQGGPPEIGNPFTAPLRFRHAIRYLPATWGEVLGRDVTDPRARAVLSQYWGYFGKPPSQCSFLYFATALETYMKLGPWHVQGGSQALSNAFVAALEEYGGEVRFNCGARAVTTASGRVSGVLTEHDELIAARAVVSNADPIATCRELLAARDLPPSFFAGLRRLDVSASSVNVYLGVACDHQTLGLGSHENFVNRDYDYEGHYAALGNLARPGCTLTTCYNAVHPSFSPPGTSQVVLTTLSYGQAWEALSPADYLGTKQRIAEAMLDDAERIAPGLRRYAEVLEVATPLTNVRYAGATGGAIYGFANTPFDHTVFRPSQTGPLPGLFFAGAWTFPGGGFEPCMMSGAEAARRAHRFVRQLGQVRRAGQAGGVGKQGGAAR